MNNLENNVALDVKSRRTMETGARRTQKITVVKSKSNLHVILAIVCGMMIGLIASFLLVLAGGRIF